jgi:hypothetical protein
MSKVVGGYRIPKAAWMSLEIAPAETVPETDTGGLVEYTEALERTTAKELGKLLP